MSRRPEKRAVPSGPVLHHYDEHGALTGETVARADPEEPGRYLIPRRATVIPPPRARDGFIRVFDGERWSQAADERGPCWCLEKNQPAIWDRPGPRPATMVKEAPPSPAHVWDALTAAWVVPAVPPETALRRRRAALRDRLLDAIAAGEDPDEAERAEFRALLADTRARRAATGD